MKQLFGFFLAALAGAAIMQLAPLAFHSPRPADGFVPDEQTARLIAEAVWVPLYGKEQIESEKPFRVRLQDGVWIVTGKPIPKGSFGGVALAEISKRDGRILRVAHGE